MIKCGKCIKTKNQNEFRYKINGGFSKTCISCLEKINKENQTPCDVCDVCKKIGFHNDCIICEDFIVCDTCGVDYEWYGFYYCRPCIIKDGTIPI